MTSLAMQERIESLYKKLDKVDRKLEKTGPGLKYNALLIKRRSIETELRALGMDV